MESQTQAIDKDLCRLMRKSREVWQWPGSDLKTEKSSRIPVFKGQGHLV